jgi:ribosomal protein S18 acetylase RimI-like enzyme
MIAGLAERGSDLSGMRPFNPLTDLRPTAELIELAFGDALDRSSREMLREMRTLSWLLGPVFSLLGTQASPLADFYSGYVWVEEGEIVANITVHRHYKGLAGWFISNLAVHPKFRRKGIARHLMEAGIDFAKEKGAKRISLEVRAENAPARALYNGLDFHQVDSVTKMTTNDPASATLLVLQEATVRVSEVGRNGQEFSQLARQTFPPEAREILKIRETEYGESNVRRLISELGDFLRGNSTLQFGAYEEGRLAGLLTLRTGAFLAVHSLSLMVHPDHRGQVEESLLTRTLRLLESRSWRPIRAEIHPSYDLAKEVFERYGFTELETMHLLTRELRN